MKNTTCPGCGAVYNGRRCRSCGYEHFHQAAAKAVPVPVPRKERRKHPLLGFLILLLLIWALLPALRRWGLELEAMEEAHNTGYHSREVPG